MKNMQFPINMDLKIQGGSGDFTVIVIDNETKQTKLFSDVSSGAYAAPMYFGERVKLEKIETVK